MITNDQLLTKHTPLARRIAHAFKRRVPANVDVEDLVAAAMSGLWDAIRFHPEAGPGFEHYAAMRVRGAVIDELRSQDWLPRRHRALVEEGKVARVRVIYDEEENRRAAGEGDPESDAVRKAISEALVDRLRFLMPRERHVVEAYYFREEKLRDIGKRMGISEPRVSQIHSRAVEKLRARVPNSWRP